MTKVRDLKRVKELIENLSEIESFYELGVYQLIESLEEIKELLLYISKDIYKNAI